MELLGYINEDMKTVYSIKRIYKERIAIEVSTEAEYYHVLKAFKEGCDKLGLKTEPHMIYTNIETYENDKEKLCGVLLENDAKEYDIYIGFCMKHICEEDGYLIISPGDIEV